MNIFSGRVTASLPLIVSVPSDAVSFRTLPQISSCGKHLACTGAGTGADTGLFEGRVSWGCKINWGMPPKCGNFENWSLIENCYTRNA